jgi:hypothetical protein
MLAALHTVVHDANDCLQEPFAIKSQPGAGLLHKHQLPAAAAGRATGSSTTRVGSTTERSPAKGDARLPSGRSSLAMPMRRPSSQAAENVAAVATCVRGVSRDGSRSASRAANRGVNRGVGIRSIQDYSCIRPASTRAVTGDGLQGC